MRSKLLVCAPLRVEARALRAGLSAHVEPTGYGTRRAARSANKLAERDFDAMAVAGVAGGLADTVRTGDVVVGSEIRGPSGTVCCQSAQLLDGELRGQGFVVHYGPIVTTDHVVRGKERAELARSGSLAVDMESSDLATASGDRPLAVVRVIVDSAADPLVEFGTPYRAVKALRMLRKLGPSLEKWANAIGTRGAATPHPGSLCAHADRAIELVVRVLVEQGAPVYVCRQAVHDERVSGFVGRGSVFVDGPDEVPDDATVVFSTHAGFPTMRSEAVKRSLEVVDEIDPLVTKVHAEARRFTRNEGTVFFLGHTGHTGITAVGVAVGVSAPPRPVDRIVESLRGLGPLEITEWRATAENVQLGSPKEVC